MKPKLQKALGAWMYNDSDGDFLFIRQGTELTHPTYVCICAPDQNSKPIIVRVSREYAARLAEILQYYANTGELLEG